MELDTAIARVQFPGSACWWSRTPGCIVPPDGRQASKMPVIQNCVAGQKVGWALGAKISRIACRSCALAALNSASAASAGEAKVRCDTAGWLAHPAPAQAMSRRIGPRRRSTRDRKFENHQVHKSSVAWLAFICHGPPPPPPPCPPPNPPPPWNPPPWKPASAVKNHPRRGWQSPPATIMIKPTMMIIRPVPVDSTSPSIPIKIVIRPVPIRFPVIIRVAAASLKSEGGATNP